MDRSAGAAMRADPAVRKTVRGRQSAHGRPFPCLSARTVLRADDWRRLPWLIRSLCAYARGFGGGGGVAAAPDGGGVCAACAVAGFAVQTPTCQRPQSAQPVQACKLFRRDPWTAVWTRVLAWARAWALRLHRQASSDAVLRVSAASAPTAMAGSRELALHRAQRAVATHSDNPDAVAVSLLAVAWEELLSRGGDAAAVRAAVHRRRGSARHRVARAARCDHVVAPHW